MISLCVVTVGATSKLFLEIFLKSLQEKTNSVNEIIILDVKESPSFYKEFHINDVKVKMIGQKYNLSNFQKLIPNSLSALSAEHALAIQYIIQEAKNEYLLLSHPDIFFYEDAPAILKNLMDKYNLDIIGCALPGAYGGTFHCQGCFPNLIFTLVKKSCLPDENFLKDKITLSGINFDGCYFIGCDKLEPGLMNLYPYPDGHIDTGFLLYICAIKLGWRWLAIQTGDLHNYDTKYYKSNIKEIKLRPQKLIYHQSGATYFWPDSELEFLRVYEEYKKQSME